MTKVVEIPANYNELSSKQRQLVRNEYVTRQGARCSHCGHGLWADPSLEVMNKPIIRKLFPPGFFNNPVHLHHSHETGMTIGAVHARCNAILWQYYRE